MGLLHSVQNNLQDSQVHERESSMRFEWNFIPMQRLRRPKERESPSHFEWNFILIQRLRRPREVWVLSVRVKSPDFLKALPLELCM